MINFIKKLFTKRGYKVFELKDGKLWDKEKQYVIGKTYAQSGKIGILENGLDYEKKLLNTSCSHIHTPNTIICEVEDLGSVSFDCRPNYIEQTLTNKLKIIRKIDKSKYPFKYNDKGDLIYRKDSNGNKYFWEYKYDENGSKIYEKHFDGDEYFWKYKYDNKGNKIYIQYPNGNICEYKYDDKNNKVYTKSFNYELEWKFDKSSNKAYKAFVERNVEETFHTNEEPMGLSDKDSCINKYDNIKIERSYIKDIEKNVILIYNNGHVVGMYKCDAYNNLKSYSDFSKISECVHDERNNKIFEKYTDGKTRFWKYNKNNDMIFYKDKHDNEFKMVD